MTELVSTEPNQRKLRELNFICPACGLLRDACEETHGADVTERVANAKDAVPTRSMARDDER